jgi:hypothetical protein
MMQTKNRYTRLIAAALLACMLLSSCTFVTVVNNSSQDVQVKLIAPPFLGTKLALLHPGDEKLALGAVGGYFEVQVIDGKELVDALNALKDKLTTDLKQPNIDPVEVLTILDQLDTARKLIDAAKAAQTTNYCSGSVPDFGSATATVVNSKNGSTEFGDCSVHPPDLQEMVP